VIVKNASYTRRIDPTGNLFDFGGRGGGGTGASEGEEPASFPMRFDVELVVPSSLRIDNNLARMTASADLQLRGTYEHPQVFGRVDVDRGEVLFEGRRYLVTKGSVDFTNPSRIEPFFDIEAETRVRVPSETYRVTINLTGTAARFQPTFESDPPLPAADVLALLFGNVGLSENPNQPSLGNELYALDPQKANERQTDVLATRATQLLAGPISSSVGHAVEQTFGVDTFQLTPSLFGTSSSSAQTSTRVNPAARVTIGKRISDRLYLTFSRSLSSAISDQILLLEYDASDRYSWILSRNEDNTYALEVSVRHTF
jgi:translocation and assembly module TamB